MKRWMRFGLAIVAGYGAVAFLGLVAKGIIEAVSDVTYELHWLTTMPLLALVFAYVGLRNWRQPG